MLSADGDDGPGPDWAELADRELPTDQQLLLRAITDGAPQFTVKLSDDGSVWIAVERPFPPRHRIIAGFSLLSLAQKLLGTELP
jgi:hypothetical protein